MPTDESASPFRSGFCCFVGRPNAGKSTLTNALVGDEGRHHQRRNRRRPGTQCAASCTAPDAQLIIVDTPGLHRPRTLLGQRLNDVVEATLADVDVIGFCLPADEPIGPGDRYIAAQLAEIRSPKIAIITKTDSGRAEADRRTPGQGRQPAGVRRDHSRLGQVR